MTAPAASSAPATSGCDHGAPESGPAVLFFDPPLSAGAGRHDGPRWKLVARELPALSADGATVIVPERATGLSDAPNLALLEIRVDDDTRGSATPVLSVQEFVTSFDPKDAATSEANYAALGRRVCERVNAVNRELSARGFRGLESCALDAPSSVVPSCSFRSQSLTCGELQVSYRRPEFVLRGAGATRRFSRPNWAPKPVVEPDWGSIPVRECFSAAHVSASERVFVGELYNACQRGGDWCDVPPVWHVLRY